MFNTNTIIQKWDKVKNFVKLVGITQDHQKVFFRIAVPSIVGASWSF